MLMVHTLACRVLQVETELERSEPGIVLRITQITTSLTPAMSGGGAAAATAGSGTPERRLTHSGSSSSRRSSTAGNDAAANGDAGSSGTAEAGSSTHVAAQEAAEDGSSTSTASAAGNAAAAAGRPDGQGALDAKQQQQEGGLSEPQQQQQHPSKQQQQLKQEQQLVPCDSGPLLRVAIVPDNYHDVMRSTLRDINQALTELQGLKDKAAAAWAALLKHYGETAQSVASDVEFWADIAVSGGRGGRISPIVGECSDSGCCLCSVWGHERAVAAV